MATGIQDRQIGLTRVPVAHEPGSVVHARVLEPDVLSWSESVLLLGAFVTLAVSMISFVTL